MNYQALLVIFGLLAMIPITKWAFSESAVPNVVKLAIRALLTGAIFALGVYLFIEERTFNRTAKTATGVLMPDIVKKKREI